MNVLELKGSIVDMIAHLESPNELSRLREVIRDFISSPSEYEAYDDDFECSIRIH